MPSVSRVACFALIAHAVAAALLAWSATARAEGAASDSVRIHAIVADLDSAWARGDAALWASHYEPEAEFINILGALFPDVESMQARHREIFQGVFKGSRHHSTLRRLRFLEDDVAIADIDVEVTGFSSLPPGSRPTEDGMLRTRMRHVLTRKDGVWRIAASQNTAVAPRP